jgi:phosphoglycolate phosphatase-like HAD superfamily hydrolase
VQAALAKLDGEPDEAVLIGDTPWDIKAARQAGVPALGVLTGGFGDRGADRVGRGLRVSVG